MSAVSTTTKSMELVVTVKGEIVQSNFKDFRKFVADQLLMINDAPKTDIEFGAAEQDVKMLKHVEQTVIDAKKMAISKMESVNELFDELDAMGEDTRQKRLTLEKTIKSKKAEVKKEILDAAYDAIIATNKDVVHRLGLEQAIRGKRNLESIQAAADEYVQDINDSVSACREVLNAHIEEHGKTLIPDAATLELGDAKHLETELALRVEKAKAEKREAEEAARVKAEQQSMGLVDEAKTEPTTRMVRTGHCAPVAKGDAKKPEASSTDYDELLGFATKVKAAFSPIKSARAKLVNPRNAEIAGVFAEETGKAWQKLQSSLHDLQKGGE